MQSTWRAIMCSVYVYNFPVHIVLAELPIDTVSSPPRDKTAKKTRGNLWMIPCVVAPRCAITPRCLKILGKEIGRDKDALGFTKGPPRMKNQQKLKSCLDKIQGFSKNFLDFQIFGNFSLNTKCRALKVIWKKCQNC